MKVLLTRPLHDFAVKELEKRYDVEVHTGKIPMPKNLLISKIKNKDGLICYPYDKIDKAVIDSAPRLRTISTYSVGYDHIDINYARIKGIAVSYTPEVLTRATADLTIALVLAVFRRIPEGDRLIRKNNWKVIFGPYEFLGIDLYGKTIGIFGMGRIGKAVARRAMGFEMNIIYHNRKRLAVKEEKNLGVRYCTLDELFRKSDVVSIHVPHNKKTNEPISTNHPFAKMENIVMMPHSGSSTVETRREMAEICVKNLVLSLAGKRPIYQVKI